MEAIDEDEQSVDSTEDETATTGPSNSPVAQPTDPAEAVGEMVAPLLDVLQAPTESVQQFIESLTESPRSVAELEARVGDLETEARQVMTALLDAIDVFDDGQSDDRSELVELLESHWGEINEKIFQIVTVAVKEDELAAAQKALCSTSGELARAYQHAQNELASITAAHA